MQALEEEDKRTGPTSTEASRWTNAGLSIAGAGIYMLVAARHAAWDSCASWDERKWDALDYLYPALVTFFFNLSLIDLPPRSVLTAAYFVVLTGVVFAGDAMDVATAVRCLGATDADDGAFIAYNVCYCLVNLTFLSTLSVLRLRGWASKLRVPTWSPVIEQIRGAFNILFTTIVFHDTMPSLPVNDLLGLAYVAVNVTMEWSDMPSNPKRDKRALIRLTHSVSFCVIAMLSATLIAMLVHWVNEETASPLWPWFALISSALFHTFCLLTFRLQTQGAPGASLDAYNRFDTAGAAEDEDEDDDK